MKEKKIAYVTGEKYICTIGINLGIRNLRYINCVPRIRILDLT